MSERARKLIGNEENEIYYNIISRWEVEIKHLAYTDEMPVLVEEIAEYCGQSKYKQITIKENHVFAMKGLKRKNDIPPHKDSFDWILICQADAENMAFVTHDSLIPSYKKSCILFV